MLKGFHYSLFAGIILISSFITGCQKVEDYPDEPIIAFESFEPEGESGAVLKINFTDGDGDIGLMEEDTLPPFCPDECDYYFNLFCEYYELQEGEWVVFDNLPAPFYYRVPIVEPSGQNPSLKGEIHIDMNAYYHPNSPYDTCRMSVKLVDRSLNESNTVFTRTYTKP